MCKVIAVTNRKLCVGDFWDRIEMLCRVGVDQIVLREKDLSLEEYTTLAKRVLAICEPYPTVCVLHRYPDAARALGAGAIHLSVPGLEKYREEQCREGQYREEQYREKQYRKGLTEFALVGASVHSPEQLAVAADCGVDYVFYGHVFPTDCKKGVPARGLEALREICQQAEMPVYAIGGISGDTVEPVVAAGAAGVCVMSFGMQAEEGELREFVERVRGDGVLV